MTDLTNDSLDFNNETIDLLLETAKSEYENEHRRTSIIDTKASIALPVLFAFFIALVQMSELSSLFHFPLINFKQWSVVLVVFIMYVLSCIVGIIAMIYMIKLIFTRNYYAIKISDLYNKDLLKNEKKFLCIYQIKLYSDAIEYNKIQNDERVKWLKKSLVLMFISIVTYSIFIIIKNNLL